MIVDIGITIDLILNNEQGIWIRSIHIIHVLFRSTGRGSEHQDILQTPLPMTPFLSLLLLLAPSILSSELCLHSQDTLTPLLIVSRLDGKVTALSLTPALEQVWEVDLGHPLLAASTNMALKDDEQILPSLDGNLYSMIQNEAGVSSIQPYSSLDALLSQQAGPDSRWVGGKVVTTRGVSPPDGRVLYQCNIDNCHKYNDSLVGVEPMIALTDEKKTVRLLDLRRGVEEWSWSVTSVELQYIGVKHRSSCMPPVLPVDLHFDVESGLIRALFTSGHFASIQLPGPLSQSWILNKEFLRSVNMFYTEPSPGEPASLVNIYLGQWKDTIYIQPFTTQDAMLKLNRINQEIFYLESERMGGRSGRNTISWEHPSTTAVATVKTEGRPYYHDIVGKVWSQRIGYIPPILPPDPEIVIDKGEVYSWIQGMILTALLGIITAYGVYRKVFKRKPLLADMSTETDVDDNLPMYSTSSPLVNNVGFNFDNPSPPFESRFEQDFEIVRELGQGGFGKVIEARHKISEHNYAIKIIKLSQHDDVKKMEREVAAMAKLEHPNILRYYNSWKESPTTEWTRTRKYTHTSDSVDSGTSTGMSASFSWGTRSNVRTQTSDRCFRLQVDDDSISDILKKDYRPKRRKSADRSESIVFRDDSESIVFEEESESIVFRDESERHVLNDTEKSDSIIFKDSSVSRDDSATDYLVKVISEDSHLLVINENELSMKSNETTKTSNSGRRSVTFGSMGSSELSSDGIPPGRQLFLYIQMQLCSEETLKEWLVRNTVRDERSLTIFREIVDAVEYIHSHNHIHRDMKPSNILFGEDGRVKVADFGLATVITSTDFPSTDSSTPDFRGPSLTHNLGTKLYMSPELETSQAYNYKVDIYALGIILFELLVVFGTVMERVELIEDLRKRKAVPSSLESRYAKYKLILLQMIANNPDDRPTATEVKTFFSDTHCDQIDFSKDSI